MKHIWPYIHALIFVASFWAGMVGQGYEHTNADWIFVAVSFVGLLIFPSMIISSALARTTGKLPKASFSRGFFGLWRTDPMQHLQTSIVSLGGWFLGSLVTLPHASPQGVMIVWWKAGMLLGLLAGTRIAQSRFRDSIT